MQRTTVSAGSLHYRTSLEEVTGETLDISDYLDFSFYDWCWYNNNIVLGDTKLGKRMVVSHRIRSIMSYWVLTANGTVVSIITRVTILKAKTDENKARITALDKETQDRFNEKSHVIVEGGKGKPEDWSEHIFGRDQYFQEESSHVVSNEEVTEADDDFSPCVCD